MGIVQVEGLDKLVDQFKQMDTDARTRKAALRIMVGAAKQIRDAIRAEAPVAEKDTKGRYAHKKGALKRGVKYKASRQKTENGKAIAYIIGPFGKGTAQRHLIVAGHKITGHNTFAFQGRGGVKNSLARGGERTKPDPFVQRGIERSQEAAKAAVEAVAHEALGILANG